ncbi:MAG: hypothetical protein Rhob2KO_53280 [Rhodopirellula baltica]
MVISDIVVGLKCDFNSEATGKVAPSIASLPQWLNPVNDKN